MIKRAFYTLWKLSVAGGVLLFIASHFSTVIHDFSTKYITHPVRGFYAALCNTVPIPVFEIGAVILVLAIPFLAWRYIGGFGRITPLLIALEIILFGYIIAIGIDGAIPERKENIDLDESSYSRALENITKELEVTVDSVPENFVFDELEIRAAALNYAYGELDSHFTHVPRIKLSIFDSMMKDLGVRAYYAPVTAEVIVSRELSEVHRTSASMHELMHFVGVTDEDVAVYHSVIALLESKSVQLRYSGMLEAYVHVGSALYKLNPEKYLEISSKLPPRVTKDLNSRRSTPHSGELGDMLNDAAITLRDPRGADSYKNASAYLASFFEKDISFQ